MLDVTNEGAGVAYAGTCDAVCTLGRAGAAEEKG